MAACSKTVSVSQVCGYKCEFIRPISEDLKCVLCKHVAKDVHATSCCKKPFCQECIAPVLRDKKACPSCKQAKFVAELSRRDQKRILARKVRCTMKDRGCKWTGKLEYLEAHLDINTGDCEYVEAGCPKSGRSQKYDPIPCPNRCGIKSIRSSNDLDDHLKHCPLQVVGCDLRNAGCDVKVRRQDLEKHMEKNTQKHLSLMLAMNLRTESDFERKLQGQQIEYEEKLEEKECQLQVVKEQLQETGLEIALLKQQMKAREQQVERLSRENGVPPFHFSFEDFNKTKRDKVSIGHHSAPMYTHPHGYKFQACIWANGRGAFTGTHVSIEFEPLRGNFDDKLKWPAKFTITLELLNQYRDRDHISVSETFEYGEPVDWFPASTSHTSVTTAWSGKQGGRHNISRITNCGSELST